MTSRTKWGLLGGLLLLWAALIAFRVMSEPEPQRVPLKFVSGQVLARETNHGTNEIPASLRPMDGTTVHASFRAPKNIFAPLDLRTDEEKAAAARVRLLAARKKAEQAAAAAAPAPPPPTPEELAAQEAQRQAELARQQKEQAIQQARRTMGQYRFLGYLTRNGAPQAFLGKGTDIYIVKVGETVEGRIQVITIDATTVKLVEQTTSTETSLPLVKEGS
jgi:hypothetical protein